MAVKKCTADLSARDLDFLVETVSPNARNKKRIGTAIREDRRFRTKILGNDLVFERIAQNRQLVVGISPVLLFEVLLRRSVKEMRENVYTVERTFSQKIPVFDTKETLELLDKDGVLDYLIGLLVSFVSHQRQTAADIDIENLLKLGNETVGDQHFEVCKRIADICLFTLGVFPEYVMYDYYYLFFNKKIPVRGELTRTMGDYEMLGQEFYGLAAKHEIARTNDLDRVLGLLSQKFHLAKKPLNYMSEHFIVKAK
ncbi:MAG: hypothetical protein ABIG29_00965 [Candidatus Nealsonbacteria bacterium]